MDGAPFGREVVVDIYPLVTAVTSETEEPRDCVRMGAREGPIRRANPLFRPEEFRERRALSRR